MTVGRFDAIVEVHACHPVLHRLYFQAGLKVEMIGLLFVRTSFCQCSYRSIITVIVVSVAIVERQNRPCFKGQRLVKIIGQSRRAHIVFACETHIHVKLQPIGNLGIDLGSGRKALQVFFADIQQSILIEVAARSIVIKLFTSSAGTHIMFL